MPVFNLVVIERLSQQMPGFFTPFRNPHFLRLLDRRNLGVR